MEAGGIRSPHRLFPPLGSLPAKRKVVVSLQLGFPGETLSPGCACPPVPSWIRGFQEARLIGCWFQFHQKIFSSLSLLFYPTLLSCLFLFSFPKLYFFT